MYFYQNLPLLTPRVKGILELKKNLVQIGEAPQSIHSSGAKNLAF